MFIKTAAALVATLVIGASSAALADYTEFDVSIYRPMVQPGGPRALPVARSLPAPRTLQMRIAPSHDSYRARAEERAPGFGGNVCIPMYDSAGVQKAPYCHR